MKTIIKFIISAYLIFACTSCSVVELNKLEKHEHSSESVTPCTNPRPQICTREYRPVCAAVETGINCITTPRPSTKEVTYATGCTACADPKVRSYRPGKCKATD